jgi:phosphate transport system protein
MLRELISILRSSDPLRELGAQFTEMLRIARELTLKAGKIFFEGQEKPEERSWVYEQDILVNQLQRRIRKQVIAHLSVSGNSADLPYCLLLMSLVKDVERIGDYAKNLTEITEFFDGPLPDDDIVAELREVRHGVEATFHGLSQTLDEADQESALRLIEQGKDIARRCDILVVRAAHSSHSSNTTAAIVLATRHYKRIGGHVMNILSSVVMPLHKIDYYDEDSIPEHLKTQP